MVRLIKCNSLDLSLFQFDFDLTFAVFFLNADRTIYARYGTRTSKDAEQDVALEGLTATMHHVLELHQKYPDNRSSLRSKQPPKSDHEIPESFAKLKKFDSTLDYNGQVAKSCIHCHQVREAMRDELRIADKPIPNKLLFPYPAPAVLGVHFDKSTIGTVASVDADSIASAAGLIAGDQIKTTGGTDIASEADFQWILEQATENSLAMDVERDWKPVSLQLQLPDDWRLKSDPAWRTTSWDLRRMVTGGVTLEPIDADSRAKLGIEDGKMALRAKHVGRFGDHARARRAGLRVDDIIVQFHKRDDLLRECDVFRYGLQQLKAGDTVEILYLRNGKQSTARIKLQ